MYITDKQNKGLFVFDTVFIRTIIWLILSGSPDNAPDKDSIKNKMPVILYVLEVDLNKIIFCCLSCVMYKQLSNNKYNIYQLETLKKKIHLC